MGYFFREIDFAQDVDYAEFCNLKVDSLYRWNKSSWSGHCDDFFIYITLNNNELWLGKAEIELQEPVMKCVGNYKNKDDLKTSSDFKKQIKKYFLLSSDKRKEFNIPLVKTREICSYMRWKIDDDQISDWIE